MGQMNVKKIPAELWIVVGAAILLIDGKEVAIYPLHTTHRSLATHHDARSSHDCLVV